MVGKVDFSSVEGRQVVPAPENRWDGHRIVPVVHSSGETHRIAAPHDADPDDLRAALADAGYHQEGPSD